MTQRSLKKGGRQKKTRICKKKGGFRKTKKRGGGLFGLLGTASRTFVGVRNVKYKDTLENRLVNKYNDYDWVKEKRIKNAFPRKEKSDYTENDRTSDSSTDQNKDVKKEVKKGWFW
jgi:hypothetical protein